MEFKLPFVLSASDFDFRPRIQIGQRTDLEPITKAMVDTIDVLEQRQDKLRDAAIVNRNLLLFVVIAILPQLYALLQLWLKSPS